MNGQPVALEHCCVLAKDDAIAIKTRKPRAMTARSPSIVGVSSKT